jgi:hypothetical protein
VIGDVVVELLELGGVRQFAVQQQIADLEEARLLGQLIDGIAPVQQHALVAVDEGDLALAARRRGEAGVVGEDVGFGVQLSDIDDGGTVGSRQDRQLDGLAAHVHFRRIAHAIPFQWSRI